MALTQEPQSILTDPLALRFMTGDQMGYMPQAQYLTPSEYGAFRTVPDPARHNYLHQDPGLLQSLLIRTRGSLGFMPAYTWNTYNPAVNMQQYMYSMNAKSDDGLAAGVGAVLDTFNPLSIAAGFALGGIPGFAAGMMMPGVSRPFLDRIRDMRGIQNISMSKIVGGSDLNQATGAGFNAASARSLDSFLRLQSSGDAFLKQGDWRKLLELGVENGQFDYAGNVEQYKDALKKLRKSVTTIMEVAGSTDFKDLMKEYKRMRTMGADINEYVNIARKEDMYSRITGMRHEDMVNTFGQQGALIYQQAGLTGYQGSLQSMHNAASITLMQRTGLLSPGSLSRYGGLSGMTQAMTQQSADAQNKIADFMLPYFMKDDASGLDDSASMTAVLNSSDPLGMLGRAAGRKTRTLEQRMRFDHNRGDLMQKFQERYGQETIMAVMALQTGKQAHLKGIEAMEFGYRQLGFDPNIAHLKAKTFASNDFREQEERELQLARRKQREEEDVANNPFRKLALSLDKTFTRLGENIFGGMVNVYTGWAERRANHSNEQYNAGAGMANSAAWNAAQARAGIGPEYTGVETPQGPVAHPVKDVAALAGPAAKAASGGDITKIGWDKQGGTRYGMFQWDTQKTKDFSDWLKTQGAEGKSYWERIQSYGGIRDFGSLAASQSSALAGAWSDMAQEEKFNELTLKFAKEKLYDPALQAISPEARAQVLSSHTAQKMLFMEAMNGELKMQKPATGAIAADIGNIIASEESGKEGIYKIGYDSTGGTSYGKWQLSSTSAKGGEGSYQVWLLDLEKKGGKYAEIAKTLKSAGPLNTGGRSGAAVETYLRLAKANPQLFEETQRETLLRHNHLPAMRGLKSETLRKLIENDRGLQEVMFSTAVQHGGGGARDIFNKVYREGMDRTALIDAVYAERGAPGRFKSSTEKVKRSVRKRFKREAGTAHRIPKELTPVITSNTVAEIGKGNGSISQQAITDFINKKRQEASGNSERLAALDLVEKELMQDKAADNYRHGIDQQSGSEQAALKAKFDAEVSTASNQISGEVTQSLSLNYEAHGALRGTVDIGHLDQLLNRFESGVDLKNSTPDYEGIADILGKSSGKKLDIEQKKRLAAEMKKQGSAGKLRSLETGSDAKKYVSEILRKSGIGLNDKEIEAAANDPVLRAAMISTGLHALPKEEAEEIIKDFEISARNAEINRHTGALRFSEKIYEKNTREAFEIALPGVSDLGGAYKQDLEALLARTYKGSDSTPFALNMTRLSVLKKLAMEPGTRGIYGGRFREEAKKHGFTDKWIDNQLRNVNDISLEDIKDNVLFKSLTEQDMAHIHRVSEGVYRGLGKVKNRDERMLAEYDKNLPDKNSLILTPQAKTLAAMKMASAAELARRLDARMKPQELLTPAGLARARRMIIEGNLGAKEDREIIEKAWNKFQKGGTLSYDDFAIHRAGALSAADEYTRAARNQDRTIIALSQQMQKETQARVNAALPEAQKINNGAQNTQGQDSPLKDSTVAELVRVLEGLKGVLRGWESKPGFTPKVR